MTVVGSAEVVVRAIGDKLQSDIRKQFNKTKPIAGQAGDEAGKAFSERMASRIGAAASEIYEPLEDGAAEVGDKAGKSLADRIRAKLGGGDVLSGVASSAGDAGRQAADQFAADFEGGLPDLGKIVSGQVSSVDVGVKVNLGAEEGDTSIESSIMKLRERLEQRAAVISADGARKTFQERFEERLFRDGDRGNSAYEIIALAAKHAGTGAGRNFRESFTTEFDNIDWERHFPIDAKTIAGMLPAPAAPRAAGVDQERLSAARARYDAIDLRAAEAFNENLAEIAARGAAERERVIREHNERVAGLNIDAANADKRTKANLVRLEINFAERLERINRDENEARARLERESEREHARSFKAVNAEILAIERAGAKDRLAAEREYDEAVKANERERAELSAENAKIRAEYEQQRLRLLKEAEEADAELFASSRRRAQELRADGEGLRRIIGGAAVKLSILGPIIGVLVGGVSNLVGGLFALGSAVGQVTPALAVLPGLIGTIISSLVVSKLAFSGVGDALKNGFDPEKAKEYREALDKLPESAQSFVEKLVSMKDKFKELRTSAADGLFPDLTKAVDVLGRKLDGVLQPILKETGAAMGSAALHLARDLTSAPALENLGRVSDSNAVLIKTIGNIIGDLARSLLALTAAAAPTTERFTRWIESLTASKRASLEAGAANGELAKKITRGGDSAAQFGRIFGNLVETIRDFGKIAAPYGQILVDTFEKSTEGMAKFTDTAKGKKRIDDFFSSTNRNFLAISSMLAELGKAFLRLGENPGIAKAAESIEKITPSLEAALKAGTNNIPALVSILGSILDVFTEIASSPEIKAVINLMAGFAEVFKTLISTPVIGDILKAVAGLMLLSKVMRTLRGIAMPPEGLLTRAIYGGRRDAANARVAAASQGLAVFSSAADNANRRTTVLGRAQESLRAKFRGVGIGAKQGFDQAGKASAGVESRTRTAAKGLGKLGLAAGGVAVATSSLGDGFALANTASLTAAGSIAGPWGAAAGFAVGAVLDIKASGKKAQEETKAFYSNVDKIIKGGDAGQQSSTAAQLEKKIADLRRNADIASDPSNVGGVGGAMGEFSKKFDAEATKVEGRLAKLREKMRTGTTDINVKIAFEQASDDFDGFVKEVQNKSKRGLNLNIKTQIGRDTLNGIQNLGAAAGEAGLPAVEAFRKKIVGLKADLGLTTTQAQLLANKAAGLGVSIEGVPNAKNIKFGANTEEALTKIGFTKEEIESLKDKVVDIKAKDNAKPVVNSVRDLINGVKPAPIGIRAADKTKPTVNALEAYVNGIKPTVKVDANTDAAKAEARRLPSFFDTITQYVNVVTRKSGGDRGNEARAPKTTNRATGGFVYGAGTATSDSIAAMLSNGEFVVRAKMAKKYASLLKMINAGAVPKFASGGQVGGSSGADPTLLQLKAMAGGGKALTKTGKDLVSGLADGMAKSKGKVKRRSREVAEVIARLIPSGGQAAAEGPLKAWANGSVASTLADLITSGLGLKVEGPLQFVTDAITSAREAISETFDVEKLKDDAKGTEKTRRAAEKASRKADARADLTAKRARGSKGGKAADKTARTAAKAARAADKAADKAKKADAAADKAAKLSSKRRAAALAIAARYEAQLYEIGARRLVVEDQIAKIQDVRASVGGSLQGGLQLSAAGGFAGIAGRASAYLGKLRTFAGKIKELQRAGIPGSLIQEITGLGVAGGIAAADSILGASESDRTQLVKDYADIASVSDSIGKNVGEAYFSIGASAKDGFLEGLLSEQGQLTAAAQAIADDMARAIKHALGIASPSKLMRKEVGRFVPLGIVSGIDDTKGQLRDAMDSLVSITSIPPAGGSGAPQMTMSTASAGLSGDRPIYLDGGVLFGVLRELANGEAEIVVARALNQQRSDIRFGNPR